MRLLMTLQILLQHNQLQVNPLSRRFLAAMVTSTTPQAIQPMMLFMLMLMLMLMLIKHKQAQRTVRNILHLCPTPNAAPLGHHLVLLSQ